jgi:hypothetical protein
VEHRLRRRKISCAKHWRLANFLIRQSPGAHSPGDLLRIGALDRPTERNSAGPGVGTRRPPLLALTYDLSACHGGMRPALGHYSDANFPETGSGAMMLITWLFVTFVCHGHDRGAGWPSTASLANRMLRGRVNNLVSPIRSALRRATRSTSARAGARDQLRYLSIGVVRAGVDLTRAISIGRGRGHRRASAPPVRRCTGLAAVHSGFTHAEG